MVTLPQKLFCITTALTGLAATSFVGYHAYDWMCAYREQQLELKSKKPRVYEYQFDYSLIPILAVFAAANVGSVYGFYKANIEIYRHIKNTTKCCNIMRATLVGAVANPLLIGIFLITVGVCRVIYDEERKRYQSYQ